MIKPKHIPIRTCVACRNTDAKRGLLRVVRLSDGSVAYDPKGKTPGRGAYVCAQPVCIALARKQKKLERSLKVTGIPESLFHDLVSQANQLGREDAGPRLNADAAVSVLTDSPKLQRKPAALVADGPAHSDEDEHKGLRGAEPQESEE